MCLTYNTFFEVFSTKIDSETKKLVLKVLIVPKGVILHDTQTTLAGVDRTQFFF